MPEHVGKIVSVIGPVVDIRFDAENLPDIYNAIEINMGDKNLLLKLNSI